MNKEIRRRRRAAELKGEVLLKEINDRYRSYARDKVLYVSETLAITLPKQELSLLPCAVPTLRSATVAVIAPATARTSHTRRPREYAKPSFNSINLR